jgi:hypothetical protein
MIRRIERIWYSRRTGIEGWKEYPVTREQASRIEGMCYNWSTEVSKFCARSTLEIYLSSALEASPKGSVVY